MEIKITINIDDKEVRSLFKEAIKDASLDTQKQEAVQKKKLDVHEAVEFLTQKGYKITKSSIYILTHKNEIPFKKFGKSLQFDSDELIAWAESRSKVKKDVAAEQMALIAASARKQMKRSTSKQKTR